MFMSSTSSSASNDSHSDRPLYVALTRAKQTLTLLQNHKHHHPILAKIAATHAESIALSKVVMPKVLTFHRFMRLDEMVLTPLVLVNNTGREFIEQTFALIFGRKTAIPLADYSECIVISKTSKVMVFILLKDNKLPNSQSALQKSIQAVVKATSI
ncbi:hypothetical protein [Psychrobacter frigidicola]|uniref:hypothetical protein n=1 Tax=Psychrobacter frigidicola TaxID=45611 RepID=UPI00191B1849|nr:hypothetical protein [Psychrobacter frigidicola]